MKNILNVKYPGGPPGGAAAAAPETPADQASDAPAEEVPADEAEVVAAAASLAGGATNPDEMPTLVLEETSWPPRPWTPRSSLRRWSRSTTSRCLQD